MSIDPARSLDDGHSHHHRADADPRAVAGLEHLRALVAGRGRVADAALPEWVTVSERLRARWLEVSAGVRAAAALALAAGAALAGWWLLRPPPVPAELTMPTVGAASTGSSLSPAAAPTTASPALLVVHVAGAVHRPGVVQVPAGSRVIDVLEAAGGASPDAALDRLNLAAAAVDGTQVYVLRVGEALPPVAAAPVAPAPTGGGAPATDGALVDLNTADASTLEALPGVGPVTAEAIVTHRDEHGPFASVEGLLEVRGIGPAKFDALVDLVTVSG